MALKFDFTDPKNQRLLATFLVPIVVFYAFFHFMIKPMLADLVTKKAEVVTISQRVKGVEKSLEKPEKLTAERDLLNSKLEELEELLPSEENVSLMLDQFSLIENDTKVYMVGFEATETVEDAEKPYRANKYRITIESGFHQFSMFMSSVMSLPRIMSLSELNLSLNPELERQPEDYEGLEDQPRTLRIECILTSYVFKDLNVVTDTGS
ncbi:type 4a pilus biogenesis protein PilO [Candidatus Latescibacterota bacterium]